MNERIRELELQAYVEFTRPERDPSSGYVQEITGKEFSREKFALLIVRECSNLFEIEWGEEKLTGNDVGYVLKKHFGVE
jgi:hypothetical protein